jgi:hypothetical protein
MKISEVFQFLALVYSNIFQMKKTRALYNTSVSKVMAPRKNAVFAAQPLYCKHSKCSGTFVVNGLQKPMDVFFNKLFMV